MLSSLVEWIRLNWFLLTFILGLALIFVVLRTRPTEGIDSVQTLDGVLTAGQPVVLEFYSNL
jgi:hypothetical protein